MVIIGYLQFPCPNRVGSNPHHSNYIKVNDVVRKRVLEAKWICPFCGMRGRKWLTAREARKTGRHHVENIHSISMTPEIIVRRIKY